MLQISTRWHTFAWRFQWRLLVDSGYPFPVGNSTTWRMPGSEMADPGESEAACCCRWCPWQRAEQGHRIAGYNNQCLQSSSSPQSNTLASTCSCIEMPLYFLYTPLPYIKKCEFQIIIFLFFLLKSGFENMLHIFDFLSRPWDPLIIHSSFLCRKTKNSLPYYFMECI